MTLQQVAYLGDIAAAVGVIVSLLYVARQLGQSTDMMRAAASSGRVERDYQIVGPIIEDRALAEIWEKADREFDSLDTVDQVRMLFFERRPSGSGTTTSSCTSAACFRRRTGTSTSGSFGTSGGDNRSERPGRRFAVPTRDRSRTSWTGSSPLRTLRTPRVRRFRDLGVMLGGRLSVL